MLRLRYYCQGGENKQIIRLLQEIEDKINVPYEIIDLFEPGRERQVYETHFKPRAKILKKRTGKSIYKELRTKRSHRYCVSSPGTIAIIKNDQIEWWTYSIDEILHFLNQALSQGQKFLEELCTKEASNATG